MGRKVFLSVLGTSIYEKCTYVYDGFRASETRFIQQATLEYLIQRKDANGNIDLWPADSKAFILLTDKARRDNWEIPSGKRYSPKDKAEINYDGLCQVIAKMNLPFNATPVSIPDGNGEKEMWNIFETIYNLLEEGDELFFDLTHSFRYLPMLMLVLGNYARFLKHTVTRSITYGNWEARNSQTNEAPINDLLPLATLQDWTHATTDYLRYGFADRLVELSQGELLPLLRDEETRTDNVVSLRNMVDKMKTMSEEMRFCRGIEITEASTVTQLKDNIQKSEEVVVPLLRPIVTKIDDSVKDFKSKYDSTNMFYAAQWCYSHQLFQQAVTFLEEGVISFFCERHKIDIKDNHKRELINSAFYINIYQIPEEKWIIEEEEYKPLLRELMEDALIKDREISDSYYHLVELRNIYNHCGMKRDKKSIRFIKEGVEKALRIPSLLSPPAPYSDAENQPKRLVNLSNHPSEDWDGKQREAACMYGEIVDMPFPDVAPELSHEEVCQLADEYVAKIAGLTRKYDITVHVMGEMTFTYAVVSTLKEMGIRCVASTTERIVEESEGKRTYTFRFCQFREY